MVQAVLTRLLSSRGRAALEPVEPENVEQELGQLGTFAQPAYLPVEAYAPIA